MTRSLKHPERANNDRQSRGPTEQHAAEQRTNGIEAAEKLSQPNISFLQAYLADDEGSRTPAIEKESFD